MENQSKKQSLERIPKHARRFVKLYNTSIRNALKREINAYLENKKQIKINNELKNIRLRKLVNKNMWESDLVNIEELNAFPIKTLRQIAKLIQY